MAMICTNREIDKAARHPVRQIMRPLFHDILSTPWQAVSDTFFTATYTAFASYLLTLHLSTACRECPHLADFHSHRL